MTITPERLEEIEQERIQMRMGGFALQDECIELIDEVRRLQRIISWYEYQYKSKTAYINQLYKRAKASKFECTRLKHVCSKINEEICQILGKVLGYPWFKDDKKNFPDATEVDGVCVGDHVAESIADEAASRI